MQENIYILGFDIGGTKIAISLGNDKGEIIASQRVPVKGRGPDEVLPELLNTVNELLSSTGISSDMLTAGGIGCPAPIDVPKGLITTPTNMKLWKNVPIRDYIADAFRIPVFFDNDANAAALAEWFFGAGKATLNMIYLTMSTGIGGGIIANGHLIQGKSFYAGEIGHTVLDINGPLCNCGQKGCYEAFCGGLALEKRMKEDMKISPDNDFIDLAGGIENLSTKTLLQGVKLNMPYALALWDEFILRNAQAVGILINTFNPELIVFGTIAIAAGDLFFQPLKKCLPNFAWPQPLKDCSLKESNLGHKIGEYAGLSVALNALYEQNKWKP